MVKKYKTSPWRKTAIAIYKPPRDGKVYGTYEVDATAMLDFIKKKKEQGIRITVTNVVTSAIARALYHDVPEMNCFVRRGKLIQRDHVGVFLAVARKGKSVTGFVIPKAETMTVTEIAAYQQKKLDNAYDKKKNKFNIAGSIGKIPWPFRGLVVKFIKWWVFDQGFYLPFFKIPRNEPFGSISLSNIGVFGLPIGYLALWPIANLPAALTMGIIQEKPVVINGEIVIRPMLPVSGTFDHRITEADKIGFFKDAVEKRLLDPETLDQPGK
jgi:pyruvate dehydrogenase E2 component (dihydrolipoamide acetyltransferase)